MIEGQQGEQDGRGSASLLVSCFCHLYIHKQTCLYIVWVNGNLLGRKEAGARWLGFIQVVTNLSSLPQSNLWMFTEWSEKMIREPPISKWLYVVGWLPDAQRTTLPSHSLTLPLSLLSSTRGENRMKTSWVEIFTWKHSPLTDWSKWHCNSLDTVRTCIDSVSQGQCVGYYNYYMDLLFPIG